MNFADTYAARCALDTSACTKSASLLSGDLLLYVGLFLVSARYLPFPSITLHFLFILFSLLKDPLLLFYFNFSVMFIVILFFCLLFYNFVFLPVKLLFTREVFSSLPFPFSHFFFFICFCPTMPLTLTHQGNLSLSLTSPSLFRLIFLKILLLSCLFSCHVNAFQLRSPSRIFLTSKVPSSPPH